MESEKTALIASAVFADCVMMACGSASNLTAKMCEPLRGHDVILFPDNGMFDKWQEKGKQLRHIFGRLRIADIMEREALNEGDDIGDLFLHQYPNIDPDTDWGLREL